MSIRREMSHLNFLIFKCDIMPEISRFYGIIVTMFINDHNPPHFHIRYDEYRAIIEIGSGKITGTLPPRAMKLVVEWLNLHREELYENWDLLRRGEQFKRIKPLE